MDYCEKYSFSKEKVNDCHFHSTRIYPIKKSVENYRHIIDFFNVNKFLILAMNEATFEINDANNIETIYYKDVFPNRCYAYASFSHKGEDWESEDGLLNQVKRFEKLGFDGIKMLEGKPELRFREEIARPLNDERYVRAFKYCEEKGIPMLIHCGNFKSPYTLQLADELEDLMNKCPCLRVTMAHFANLSHNYDKLCEMMESHPNLTIDLAIGGDFIKLFGDDQELWKPFLIKYQDRILNGTDTYNQFFTDEDEANDVGIRFEIVRNLFEAKEPFTSLAHGTALLAPMHDFPQSVVEKFYRTNFINLLGESPKKTNRAEVLAYAEEILNGYENGTLSTYSKAPLPDYFSDEEKANMANGVEITKENLKEIIDFYKGETNAV